MVLERVKFKSAAQRAAAAPAFHKEQSAAAAEAARGRGRRLSHGSGQLLPAGTGLSGQRPAGSRGQPGPRAGGSARNAAAMPDTGARGPAPCWARRGGGSSALLLRLTWSQLVTATFRCLPPESQALSRLCGSTSGERGLQRCWNLTAMCCVPSPGTSPGHLRSVPAPPQQGTHPSQQPRHASGTGCIPAEGLGIPVSRPAIPKALLAARKPSPRLAAPPHSRGSWSTDSTVSRANSAAEFLSLRNALDTAPALTGSKSLGSRKENAGVAQETAAVGRKGFYPRSTWQLQIPFIPTALFIHIPLVQTGGSGRHNRSESTKKEPGMRARAGKGGKAGTGACTAGPESRMWCPGSSISWAGQGIPHWHSRP